MEYVLPQQHVTHLESVETSLEQCLHFYVLFTVFLCTVYLHKVIFNKFYYDRSFNRKITLSRKQIIKVGLKESLKFFSHP